MANADLTAQRLRELLAYEQDTGLFRWRRTKARSTAGAIAGGDTGRGYIRIKLDGIMYRAHRLAWLYVMGSWPSGMVDHINGDFADNSFHNLRDVSVVVNGQNQRKAQRHNVTGLLGVAFVKRTGKYVAKITVDGLRVYLGTYSDPQEAHGVYMLAKRELHEGCTI